METYLILNINIYKNNKQRMVYYFESLCKDLNGNQVATVVET